MRLCVIDREFSVCRVADYSSVDLDGEYCFVGKTPGERSLVCPSDRVPENAVVCEGGWRAFYVDGTLDFSLIGVIAGISTLLAENGIGLFVISTYQTDYVLVKQAAFQNALAVLSANGYEIIED